MLNLNQPGDQIFLSAPAYAGDYAEQLTELLGTKYRIYNPLASFWMDFSEYPANGFRESIHKLPEAHGVVFLPGWQQARGCLSELFAAALMGTQLYEAVLDDEGWMFAVLPYSSKTISDDLPELLLRQNLHFNSH